LSIASKAAFLAEMFEAITLQSTIMTIMTISLQTHLDIPQRLKRIARED
jgi:hypothetical protein